MIAVKGNAIKYLCWYILTMVNNLIALYLHIQQRTNIQCSNNSATCFVLWFTVVHLPQLIIFYEIQRMKIYIVVTRECVVLVISQFYLGQKNVRITLPVQNIIDFFR